MYHSPLISFQIPDQAFPENPDPFLFVPPGKQAPNPMLFCIHPRKGMSNTTVVGDACISMCTPNRLPYSTVRVFSYNHYPLEWAQLSPSFASVFPNRMHEHELYCRACTCASLHHPRFVSHTLPQQVPVYLETHNTRSPTGASALSCCLTFLCGLHVRETWHTERYPPPPQTISYHVRL